MSLLKKLDLFYLHFVRVVCLVALMLMFRMFIEGFLYATSLWGNETPAVLAKIAKDSSTGADYVCITLVAALGVYWTTKKLSKQ